jgi:lactoylglutathione lyase
MKIEHVAIWVNDLERMKDFYKEYFNMRSFLSYFLSFEGVARIEIMHRPDISIKTGKIGQTNGPVLGPINTKL